MKSILSTIVLFGLFSGITLGQEQDTTTFGLNPNEPLIEKTLFGEMTLLIPERLWKKEKEDLYEVLQLIPLSSEDDKVLMQIRKKEGANLAGYKKLSETMASTFYKGEIHVSEYRTINEREVYVFEMTGYWNGFQNSRIMDGRVWRRKWGCIQISPEISGR